jgi:hypothetical protein
VMTPTQPKVPEAKFKGSQEGFQCVLVSPERLPGVRQGVRRGPVPPGPLELAARVPTRAASSGVSGRHRRQTRMPAAAPTVSRCGTAPAAGRCCARQAPTWGDNSPSAREADGG